MREEKLIVRIRSARVALPVYGDAGTTERIAAEVEARLAAVEEEGGPIDTLAFALRVACDYAAELAALRQEAAEDERQLLRLLEHLRGRLTALTEDE